VITIKYLKKVKDSSLMLSLLTTLATGVMAVETFTPQEPTLADSTDPFSMWLSEQMLNYTDFEVDLKGGRNIPKYLEGTMINAGPSLFKIGKYALGNYADGFVRFNKY